MEYNNELGGWNSKCFNDDDVKLEIDLFHTFNPISVVGKKMTVSVPLSWPLTCLAFLEVL